MPGKWSKDRGKEIKRTHFQLPLVTEAHFSKVPVGPVILMSLLPGLVTVHELVFLEAHGNLPIVDVTRARKLL